MIDWYWKEVDELESQGKWNEAKDYMYQEWKRNPQDVKTLIRLVFLCWIVVVEWGCLDGDIKENLNYDEFERLLHELTQYGLEHFDEDADFLWIYGYMIYLFPYEFGDYDEWENKGKAMIEKAHQLRPDDPIIKLVLLGSKWKGHTQEYIETCKTVASLLPVKFRGKGEMQEYFKKVLNRRDSQLSGDIS